jgi:hypothetical protein
VELRERSRREERDRLRKRVIRHVQQRTEDGRFMPRPMPTVHDPDVLDVEYASRRSDSTGFQDERHRRREH